MESSNFKSCQFCGEDIKPSSYFCHHCNHVQKDQALAYERFLRIQVLRYGAIVISFAIPLSTLGFYLGMLEMSVAIIYNVGQVILICLFVFPLLSLLFSLFPESSFKDIKIPYLLERIEYCRKAMIWNLVIFPTIAGILVFAQIKLAQNKPSLKDFRTYLKTEKAYSEKGVLKEGECALLTYHLVANREGLRLFVGLNDGFYSFDPTVFSEISK